MNDKQSEAVLATEGPVLIMAGAGSGKTRVLTHRVAYLIEEKHVNPWNVLAITFTNKAAREMKERIGNLLDEEAARDVWVSTFHALCMRILRRDIEKLGYNRAFSITDTSAQLTLVKQVLRAQNVDPKQFDAKAVLSAISSAKNDLLTPTDYAKDHANNGNPFDKVVSDVYTEYQRRLRADSALDFDDLIMQTIILFKQDPETLGTTSASSTTSTSTNTKTPTRPSTSSCRCCPPATATCVSWGMRTRVSTAGVAPTCRTSWTSRRTTRTRR